MMTLGVPAIALEVLDPFARIHAAGEMTNDLRHALSLRGNALEHKCVAPAIAYHDLDSPGGHPAHAGQLAVKLPQVRGHV